MPAATTLSDVKAAAKESGFKKWQERWTKAETGRNLFEFRPRVDYKMKHSFESAGGERAVAQLRTGYVRLNDYLCRVNVSESITCQGGEIETVMHYLLHCPLFEEEREVLRKRLFDICGIIHLDLNMLLDAKKEDEFKEWRDTILSELESYVAKTQRFAARPINQ